MRTSLVRFGLGFGHLGVKVRGTTKYHLSPMEQRAFAGAISSGVPNTLWRIRRSILTVVPPFIIAYLIYDASEKEHDRLQRKQPGQFDHEV
ncbi:cytochrome b-c1 complex subunit 8 [Eurytemora carolleeae]|uniref:cytochrome b-c1 complex subunit 8 n=1 Tax=Eurytemora carolleeae TaxID=1294199 RepID=UPI000C75A730|nr:cytochrome b-c1 complex subunit 8 [Eurytemora carolleeae]|eukprot:XP_023348451.1 cytochrome b-c1 complex subunit 8-like [Eurytemora affinis]